MRVLVASDFELGSHRAHAINVVKTAGGFRRLGHEVTLACRASGAGETVDSAARDLGEPGLRWVLAPPVEPGVPDAARAEDFARFVAARRPEFDLLYARHFAAGLAGAEHGLPTAVETHSYVGDANPLLQRSIDATRGLLAALITISPTLRDHYISRGADPARTHVVPDGVDLDLFAPPTSGIGAAPFERWSKRGHALYAGHLYDYKGIPTVIDAAARSPDVGFELVGGTPEDIARTRDRAARAGLRNVRIHGQRPHAEVPRWLWHADVLLLTPSAAEPSAAWTSPVKLGEYLASGKPVVASHIPGLTTWVGEPAVRWFTPDDPADLARAIGEALRETATDQTPRVTAARALADRFSYPQRAMAILDAAARGATAAGTPLKSRPRERALA
jgi:glycosyltransferase involved in cell wall biosynthesis